MTPWYVYFWMVFMLTHAGLLTGRQDTSGRATLCSSLSDDRSNFNFITETDRWFRDYFQQLDARGWEIPSTMKDHWSVDCLFIFFFLELTTFPSTLNTCRVRFNLVSDEPHTSVDELIARSIQNYHSKEGLDALEKILKSAKDIKKHAINDILHAHTLIQGHRDAVFQLGIVR
jgi:hypothetical protein